MSYKTDCAGYRAVQAGFDLFIKLMKRPPQTVINRPGAVKVIPKALEKDGIDNVLIVTDPGLVKAGVLNKVIPYLEEAGVKVSIYGDCNPDPTYDDVNKCLAKLQECQATGIIAVGGGSTMDTAKMAMALNSLPKIANIGKLAGNSTIGSKKIKPFLPLYVVPTTAGTGSDASTVAALSDPVTHKKCTVQDTVLLAPRVFLDGEMMLSVPASVTAATGFDALTHAVESYLGVYYGNKQTDKDGLKAVHLIMKSLRTAYADGSDLQARCDLATGSYLAGRAFTTAAVGYAHSFAHSSAMIHHIPHGQLCAIMLPDLLDFYFESCIDKFAVLAQAAGVTDPEKDARDQASDFVEAVYQLREDLHLPTKLPAMSDLEIELLCERSLKEANPIYPVPRIMSMDDARAFVRRVSEQA